MLYHYCRYTLTISAIMQKHIAQYAICETGNMLWANWAICFCNIADLLLSYRRFEFSISPIYIYQIRKKEFINTIK